jgi:hypothetical protein
MSAAKWYLSLQTYTPSKDLCECVSMYANVYSNAADAKNERRIP